MKVKIAVFGLEETLKRVQALTEKQERIEILPFIYTDSREVPDLIERAFMCDVYLFTGAVSYYYARDKIMKKRLPALHVAFDEYMILTSFYRLKNNFKQPLDRFSIDIPDGKRMEKVSKELRFKDKEIYTYSYGEEATPDLEQIVAFHHDLWNEGKIDYILSSSREVESRMKDLGLPASCMIIPEINIEHAIEQAKSLIGLKSNNSPLLVSGYIQFKNSDWKAATIEAKSKSPMDKLSQILTEFSKKTNAIITPNQNDQFVIVGTKKLLDHLQSHYRDFPLISEIESTLDYQVDIGFGLGLTVKEAESHALLALNKCSSKNSGLCYIVNERKDTIGPIGIRRDIDTSHLFHSLIHKARLNNELSYNFIDFITERNNEPFSSNDIATFYKVTKRSAERTVNKLLSGNVIKVSGEERPYLKGRPRKLFTLNQ